MTEEAIEIKGLRIGMSKNAVIALHGRPPLRNFTIAGLSGVRPQLDLAFHEDRLDYWVFLFDAERFDDMQEALKAKYPQLKCTEYAVANRLGAPYVQTECSLRDAQSLLTLRHVAQDMRTSALTMTSLRRLEALEGRAKPNLKDL